MALKTRTWCAIGLGLLIAGGVMWTAADRQGGHLAQPEAATLPAKQAIPLLTRSSAPADVAPSTNTVLRNTIAPLKELMRKDSALLLGNASIDLSSPQSLAIPAALKAGANPGAYLVHARAGVTDALRQRIVAAGAAEVSYIPNNALLVSATPEAARQLAADRLVDAVLPYEPYFKLDEKVLKLALAGETLDENALLRITLFANQKDAGRTALASTGGKVLGEASGPFGPILTVKPGTATLAALAQLPQVSRIEPQYRAVPMTDLARTTLGVSADVAGSTNSFTNYLGLTGKGVLIGMNDSGVDVTHPDLKGRVFGLNTNALYDEGGHGTHVAGILIGDGTESDTVTNAPGSATGASFRGMASKANLYVVPFDIVNGPEGGDSFLVEAAAKTNASVVNNSWGYSGSSVYDSAAAVYDAAVRDAKPGVTGLQPLTLVFSSGNAGSGASDGTGGNAGSIVSPGTAKNVITVGYLEQARYITNEAITVDSNTGESVTNQVYYVDTDSDNQVATESSRGNVSAGTEGEGGRFKPDLVAPGMFVVSTRSSQWTNTEIVTSSSTETYHNRQVVPGEWNDYFVLIEPNAVSIRIVLGTSLSDTNNLPQLPIYGRYWDYPDTTFYDAYGLGRLSLPGSGELQPGTIFNFIVGNNGADTVNYNMIVVQTVTNSSGGRFEVMNTLNNGLGKYYRFESGSSMAAPMVSGMLALMKEFFEQKLPSELRHTNSPALMKALLINGARSVGMSYDFQVQTMLNLQGWGMPNLENSLPAYMLNTNQLKSAPLQFFDQDITNAVATGEHRTWKLALDSSASLAPLRFTLVWTDPPGNPSAGIKLVNDLDLVVTNLDTGDVYWGNDIEEGSDYNASRRTNEVYSYSDVVNNVENVFINTPFLQGTNLSVTVIGKRVNVNAVTATNRTAQDFALVLSSADMTLTNAFTLTYTNSATSYTSNYSTVRLTNAIPLLEQRVGANSPLISGTEGSTNQWRFYVFTNSIVTNEEVLMTNGPYVAFITFTTPNLAIPRDSEGDIDMYVSTNSALTNLDLGAIATADVSRKRGGNELVFYTNSALGTIYYIGIKAEDQQAAEFGIVALSSDRPFDEATPDGGRIIHGMPMNLRIPDGSASKPGRAIMFGVGTVPVEVGRVVVTNVIDHENMGDLLGNLSHEGKFAVLYNHSLNDGSYQGTNGFIFDDSNNGDIFYSQPTDGPGSLNEFQGQVAYGAWMLTVVDDSLTQTGKVAWMDIRIYPQAPLGGIRGEVAANSFAYFAVDVPIEGTNLNIYVWDIDPALPLNVYLRRGELPTLTDYDKMALIDPERQNLTNDVVVLSLGKGDVPPLVPGRYYIGIYNPNAVTVSFRIDAKIDYDTSGALAHRFTDDDHIAVLDDARVFATNHIDVDLKVVTVAVGVRINHPRPSDLVLRLTNPQGTNVVLTESRGGVSTGGYGAGTTNTGISYFWFTENTNLAEVPVKFAIPPFNTATSLRLAASDNFETYTDGVYTNGTNVGMWTVVNNQVEVQTTSITTNGSQVLNLRNGAISNAFTTVPSRPYIARIAYRRAVEMPGAVSWWKFDGGTNGFADYFGRNNAQAATQGTNYTAAKVGLGLPLVGTNYVSIPASSSLNAGSFTWEAWISPNDVTQVSPLFAFVSATNHGVSLWLTNNGSLHADLVDTVAATNATLITTNVIKAGALQYVAFTYNQANGAACLYVDGVLVQTATFAGLTPDTSSDLYFGKVANSFYKGMLDEVVWYNRALPANEIADIARAGSQGHDLTANPPLTTAANGAFTIGGITNLVLKPTNGWQQATIEFTAGANSTAIMFSSSNSAFIIDAFQLYRVLDGSYYLPEESLEAFKDQSALGDWVLEVTDSRTGTTSAVKPELISWQLQFIFATPVTTAVKLTNAVPYCGSVYGGEISYFIVETPRSASFATNILINNSGNDLILVGDRSGLPAGDAAVDDYYVDINGAGAGEGIVISTNFPVLAPLIPGSRYYLGVMNKDINTTNDFCLTVTFDKTDPTNYIDVIELTNKVPYTATIPAGTALDYYQYTVSSNAVAVEFSLFPSNGNVNLVARKYTPVIDPLPNTSKYDFISDLPGSNTVDVISLSLTNKDALLTPGIWYLGVFNMETNPVTYSILAKEKIVRTVTLTNGVPLTYTIPAGDLEDYFLFNITDSTPEAWFGLTNLSGKADFVVRANDLPSNTAFDAGRFGGSADREINLSTNGTPTSSTPGVTVTNDIPFWITATSTNLILHWDAVVGATYEISATKNVASTNWDVLASNLVATQTNETYIVPLPTPYMFFAIESTANIPGDLVLTNLNGAWYLAVLNREATNLSFTVQATAVPEFSPITPGTAESGYLPASPSWKYYTYEVSSNTLVSLIQAAPVDGNISLYVRKANTNRIYWPNINVFDAASINPGLAVEQILLSSNSTPAVLTPGTWYIGVYNAGTNEVSYNLDIFEFVTTPPQITSGNGVTNLLSSGGMDYYWFVIATNAYKAQFETYDADGNVDLYVRRGLPNPTPGLYDYASTNSGPTNEFIEVQTNADLATLPPGLWILGVSNADTKSVAYSVRATQFVPSTASQWVDEIKVKVTNSTIYISWASTIGRQYRVDGCSNLFETPIKWVTVTNIASATSTTTTVAVSMTTGLKFFRVLEIGSDSGNGGTTVTNAVSIDGLKLSVTTNEIFITWASEIGSAYRVDGTKDLFTSPITWSTITNIASATSTTTTVAVQKSLGYIFFNVVKVTTSTTTTAPDFNPKTSTMTTNGFVLKWTATAGQKFQVQYSDNLVSWNTFPTTITAPASGSCEYTDTTASASKTRYYRLILLP